MEVSIVFLFVLFFSSLMPLTIKLSSKPMFQVIFIVENALPLVGCGEVAVRWRSIRLTAWYQILSLIYSYTSQALPPTYIQNSHPKLTAAASVAQSIECWSRDWGSRVQFPAGDLGVSFFATGPSWVLKCMFFWQSNLPYFKNNLSVNNEYKCQILSMRKTTVD